MITNVDIYEMFENDPEKAEELAQQGIKDWIDSYEDDVKRKRLHALHWNINEQTKSIQDPVARMNKMVEIFWDGFMEFHEVLINHQEFMQFGIDRATMPKYTQNVVNFPNKEEKC